VQVNVYDHGAAIIGRNGGGGTVVGKAGGVVCSTVLCKQANSCIYTCTHQRWMLQNRKSCLCINALCDCNMHSYNLLCLSCSRPTLGNDTQA
jgi:hypothetical protein